MTIEFLDPHRWTETDEAPDWRTWDGRDQQATWDSDGGADTAPRDIQWRRIPDQQEETAMAIGIEIGRDEPGRYLADIIDGDTDDMVGNGQIVGGRAMGTTDWTWIIADSKSDWTAEGSAPTMRLAERDLINTATAHWEEATS